MRASKNQILRYWPKKTATISPAQVAANTTAAEAFAVSGLHVNDVVLVRKPTEQTGLAIVNAFVSAENELTIVFGNLTANPITPTAAEDYKVIVLGSA